MNRFTTALLTATQRRSVLAAAARPRQVAISSFYSSMPGSPLGQRESALEERFILDHEREVIAQLRKDLAEKERVLAEKEKAHAVKAAAAPAKGKEAATKKTVDGEHIHISPVAGASGTFGKREAAAEEQYFRKVEHDKIEHLKHPEKK